ncbi:uncharacterized protein J3D65DRAFT_615739 [Phyllosticta citribraziliensis]|uniref:Uncharacterized protein n=1 Tax=Phyllosticta citribraziliensis TaxID=989973 RepID=A0ABR1LZE1_9PEZI
MFLCVYAACLSGRDLVLSYVAWLFLPSFAAAVYYLYIYSSEHNGTAKTHGLILSHRHVSTLEGLAVLKREARPVVGRLAWVGSLLVPLRRAGASRQKARASR